MNFRENETPQKLRGGYYTDPSIARYLLEWACAKRPADLLEPSCGDGAFLREISPALATGLRHVAACEIDPAEAAKAASVLASSTCAGKFRLHRGDFLEWALQRHNSPPDFDAVVGNPPFIRYQYLDPEIQGRSERLIRLLGLPFTKHTNAWVPFVVASLARLRSNGRLAMVVPAELLHILHAQSARDYLARTCHRIVVVDPTEIWFSTTLQGVVLLLAEKKESPSTARAQIAIQRVRGRQFLEQPASALVAAAPFVPGDELTEKWTPALLSRTERALLGRIRENPGVARFSSLASADVGIVTGANKYFLVNDEVITEFGLEDFAFPMFGRSEHVPGIVYDRRVHFENQRAGKPTNFLWFGGVERKNLAGGPLRYIRSGEAAGLHRRYKCKIRDPWYSVPSVFATPVGMLKRSHDFPRLVLNTLGALSTDTAYRITPLRVPARQLVFSFVNSLTALTCELEGRHYGGGVLELVPSEIEKVLVPRPLAVNGAFRGLDRAIRSQVPPGRLLEDQDAITLQPHGIRSSECSMLREAWAALRGRRQRSGHVDSDPSDSDL